METKKYRLKKRWPGLNYTIKVGSELEFGNNGLYYFNKLLKTKIK